MQLALGIPFTNIAFHIPAYGLCFSLAFLAAIGLAHYRAADQDLDPEKMSDLYVVIILSSVVGARLLFVGLEWRRFVDRPLEALNFWRGGLVFYGGLIGAVLASVMFVRRSGLAVWRVADLAAPSIALGQAIGRLGCFANGCCFGLASSAPWACHAASIDAIPRHPTQLYEALGLVLMLVILLVSSRSRPRPGALAVGYVLMYSMLRFAVECFRGDDRGGYFTGGLSISQLISIGACLAGLVGVASIWADSRRGPSDHHQDGGGAP